VRFTRLLVLGVFVSSAACPGPAALTGRGTATEGGRRTSGVLAFLVQPSNTVAGAPIAPSVKLVAQDTLGRVLTDVSEDVTIAIGTNPGGGRLSGRTTLGAVGGLAIFDSLRIDKPGAGYTLVATATGLRSATSNLFNVQ
jgi:hypothetical protein